MSARSTRLPTSLRWGGHSLLAIRIFDKIRSLFGVELPISTLFQNQTIQDLAAVIDERVGEADSMAKVIDVTDEAWDTSTLIHAGPGNDAKPLFVVGGVGGNVNNLFELGEILGENRAVVGFQTRGILGHKPRERIEDMAAENISYMRQYQKKGPYILAGYSGGATTAFEMACQLQEMGEDVAYLFILDTYAPGFDIDTSSRVGSLTGSGMNGRCCARKACRISHSVCAAAPARSSCAGRFWRR